VTAVAGPGTDLYPDAFAGLVAPPDAGTGPAVRPDVGVPRHPDPAVLCRVAAAVLLAGRAPGALVPIYLRRPDAATPHAPKPVSA
jgi:hypothetical protein